MERRNQRIGIMGGTFDPIHIGHLITAESIRIACNLDKILFIPAGSPPHKQGRPVTEARHRYQMTVLATASNPSFSVSPMELERVGPSYTIDTVRMLAAKYGIGTDLYCITGADAVKDLLTWKEVEHLLDLCYFIAASRPGSIQGIDEVIDQLGEKGKSRILRQETPQIDISATTIRNRLHQGLSIRYMVPEKVEEYIYKENLYR